MNTSQNQFELEVDLTQQYRALIDQGAPDYGIVLYTAKKTWTPCPTDVCRSSCAGSYNLSLKVEIESNEYGSYGPY